ncbi:MAG: carboxymuconolactone decarboxylase family protein, partial [Candidatus Binatia bacterium]
ASDATFARIQAEFSSQEIVELLLAVGFYMLIARLLETTGVDLEPASEAIAAQTRKWQSGTK